mmetsp:Transcript_8619/g.27747  ORF Transcript_8619/g.27747 Transcript_8619/m.27747 type:complete len:766 (+) Transcript_8619:34-2331(+)
MPTDAAHPSCAGDPARRGAASSVDASLVTPLSAMRTAQLAPSLQMPRIRSSAALRAVQTQLLQDLTNESYLQPYVMAALQAAGQPSPFSCEDRAARNIQALVRSLLVSRSIMRSHRMACRLQRWARRRFESREPQVLVDLRRKLALIPAIMAVCGMVYFGTRFYASGIYAIPAMEMGIIAIGIVSLLLSAAIRLRQSIFGYSVSMYMAGPLFTLASMLLFLCRAWRIHNDVTLAEVYLAPRVGFKVMTHGIVLGILPSPPHLWSLCTSATALGLWLLVVYSANALGQPMPLHKIMLSLHVLGLTAAGACSSLCLSSTALRRAKQFEEVLGDLRNLLVAHSAGRNRHLDAVVAQAWRDGPLARIHLSAAQVAVVVVPLLLACGDGHWCGEKEPALFESTAGPRWAVTVGVFALALSAALHWSPLRWARLVALGVVLLPGHTPLHDAVRGVACRAWGNLQGNLSSSMRPFAGFSAGLLTCDALSHAVAGASSGYSDAGRRGQSLLEPATVTDTNMLLDTAHALLSGFVVATCPLHPGVRASLIAYSILSHVVVRLVHITLEAGEKDLVLFRVSSTVLGTGLAYVFVHNILAPTWQRERMLAELEVHRKAQLHRRTTRQLRAAISRENAAVKAAEDAAGDYGNPPPGGDGGKPMSDWVDELTKTPHGQRLVSAMLPRRARRGKRSRATYGHGLGTSSSHSYLTSPLASISETDPLGEEEMALLQDDLADISGVTFASSKWEEEADDYIMPDMSKFTFDAYGFIVPVEN